MHLLQVNMSPNLSSAHFTENRFLYELVLFEAFNLVGLATHLNEALVKTYVRRGTGI